MKPVARLFGRTSLCLIVASFSFTSCELLDVLLQEIEAGVDETTEAALKLSSPRTVDLDPEGETVYVEFSSDLSWKLYLSDEEWVTVDMKSGDKGPASVTVTAQGNYTGAVRTSVMTVVSGDEDVAVTFNQEACQEVASFKILSENASVPAEGGMVEVDLISNIGYSMKVVNDWVREVEKSGDVQIKHVFQVDPNPGTEPRTATISFCTDDTCIPYMITQEGTEWNIGDTGSTEDITQGDDIDI